MISRVAETCFWLFRQLERAESTSRLLQVNRSFILDIDMPEIERWYPLVIVMGERKRFGKLFDEEARQDEELIQNYLTWNEENPVAVKNSIFWARENARTIREVISLDMWEAINSLWHWISQGQGKRMYKRDRDRFFQYLINNINSIQGISLNTQSHETPFYFMQLGLLLERAGQTARTLDFKYHSIGPTKLNMESPIEIAQWLALLRSCSAQDAFLKKSKTGISGPSVFEFLIKDTEFPRSALYCLDRAARIMARIRPPEQKELTESMVMLNKLVKELKHTTTQESLEKSLHKELTYIVDSTTEICSQLHKDYFDPEIPEEIPEELDPASSSILAQ